ncbi:single-stranded DNA-binding protein [Moraxella sp.]|uniref:single-stranded DNA-binding protein n=1 Tax=Moraxella sp. TaxID=479 RepID=UPI0026DD5937|nr:single-stranded DNA-binding protein [Moraxella sp.]MDO4894991.1 single-stranded DNA-binding protein [Moraxella sp.]
MSSVNKVILIGRLGSEPEVRTFASGGQVTNISIATTQKWTDKNTGEPKEQTEWHRISLYNRLGEIAAQYLSKGSLVYIEASLHNRKWTGRDGIERYGIEIRASDMRMLSSNNNNQAPQGQYQAPPAPQQTQSQQVQNAVQPSPMTSMQRPPQGQSGNGYAVNPAASVADDDIPF